MLARRAGRSEEPELCKGQVAFIHLAIAVVWLWLILGLALLPIALLKPEFGAVLLPASGALVVGGRFDA